MKTKHGKAIEITDQLSSCAAQTLAQWIGCFTVIRNQKVIQGNANYAAWIEQGRAVDDYPVSNTAVAYLCNELTFLKDIPSQIRRNAGAKYFESLNAAKMGLRSRPTVTPRHKKRNCYVTNELFDVQPLDHNHCIVHIKRSAKKGAAGGYVTGVKMPFSANDAASSLYLSRKGSRFWLSMAYDLELLVDTEDEIRLRLKGMTEEALAAVVEGYDLGVTRQVTGSNSTVYHLPEEAQKKLANLDQRKARYQKKYARVARANDRASEAKKRKRTKGEKKLLDKAAQHSAKKARIQNNNSHHQSKAIAEDTPLVAVFEDIRINNMVRRPKAKQCPDTGKWLKNGAAAKRGLNRAIHGANMGQIRQFTAYKLKDRGKLMIKVSAKNTSLECSSCGNVDKENRKSQAMFLCTKCGHTANADDNAALNIKRRGITLIRSDAFSKEKTVRAVSIRKEKKAQELASSGDGDNVRLALGRATVDDVLNSESISA
jgi:putative transposase